jgi:curved DNA-binding protein CbpA
VVILNQTNLYELLGVEDDVSPADLKTAYRRKLLEEHPDKGGDQAKFDEIQRAYGILEDEEARDAYDDKIADAKMRARLVEGGPRQKKQGAEIEAAARVKTAPRQGSTRQRDWHKHSVEWADEQRGSAVLDNIVMAIKDADVKATACPAPDAAVAKKDEKALLKEQTEALYEKYIQVPSGSRQKWLESVKGPQKAALKLHAKEQQAKALEKAKKWLNK